MSKKASRRESELRGQEILSFDVPPRIDIHVYDPAEALKAARHRQGRKDELALTPRTQGFRARTGSLWIPHSGTENAAVVAIPENKIRTDKRFIKEKVFEKYENSRFSVGRVALWAYFAARQSEKDLRSRFFGYMIDAREGCLRINAGLGPAGEVDRDRIEQTEMAYRTVMDYLVYLKTFVGAPDTLSKGERRKWPQERHTAVWARQHAWAEEYLQAIPRHEFEETVQEAYYSERSRYEFWTAVRKEHILFEQRTARRFIAWYYGQDVPLEAYDNDPRAREENYVDDEYIG